MAKIGTAHIEIKPMLNAEALDELVRCIEEAVAAGYERGLAAAKARVERQYGDPAGRSRDEVVDILNDHGHHLEK